MSARPSLLLVDDDPQMLQTLACYFEQRKFNVITAKTVAEARTAFRAQPNLHLIVSDFDLPDGTGVELHSWVTEQSGASTPFLLISGSTHAAISEHVDFLAKPFGVDALQERVNALLSARRA